MGGRKPICWSSTAGTAPIFGDRHPKSRSPPWAGTIWGLRIAGFANIFTRSLGAILLAIRACALSQCGLPPLEARMLWACHWRQRQSSSTADRVLRNSVGAIRIVVCRDTRSTACSKRAIGVAFWAIPFLGTNPAAFRGGLPAMPSGVAGIRLLPGWFCQ